MLQGAIFPTNLCTPCTPVSGSFFTSNGGLTDSCPHGGHQTRPLCCSHLRLGRPHAQREVAIAGETTPESNLRAQLHAIPVEGVEVVVEAFAGALPIACDALRCVLLLATERVGGAWSA